ncbi:MAG: hypothetical protein AAF637_23925 [Pseudomonadota bacterium]
MRQEFLMISATTAGNRQQVTADVSDIIAATGGWIINHTLFSNIAATIQFSLPSQGLDLFRQRVVAAGVRLNNEDLARIRAAIEKHATTLADTTVSLNITFIHDDPDLRREVPAVPG